MSSIGIIGAGTWGMALARMLSNSGHEVTVRSAVPAEVEELDRTRRQKNLPNMEVPDDVVFTTEINEVCKGKDILLFAVPSVFVRSTAKLAHLAPDLTQSLHLTKSKLLSSANTDNINVSAA